MNLRNFIIALLFVPLFVCGQYRFDRLTIDDGLTENSITDMYQDKEGYIWFSTQDGVSQYDGYTFKNYNIANDTKTSLSDNYLWNFAEDNLGFIWVCSRDGLNRIDKRTGACIQFFRDTNSTAIVHNQVSDVAVFNDTVYAAIYGKVYIIPVKNNYAHKKNQLKKIIDPQKNTTNVHAFYVNHQHSNIYFIEENTLFNYTANKKIMLPEFLSGAGESFIKVTESKETICVTDGIRLFLYNTESKEVDSLSYDFKGAYIYDILPINNTELWVATNAGIFVFKNNQQVGHIMENTNDNGLTSNFTTSLLKDNTGKIWVGTSGNGVCIYNSRTTRFKPLSKEIFGRDYIIRSVIQDKNNRLIVCAGNKIFALKTNNASLTKTTFAKDAIKSIDEIIIKGYEHITPTKVDLGFNGDVLVGTKGNDVLILDNDLKLKQIITLNSEHQPSNVVSDFLITSSHEIWITTYYGVYVLNEQYRLIHSFVPDEKGLNTNYFLSVYEDATHQVWLGSNKGIYKYLKTTDTFKNYPHLKNNMNHSPGFNFISGFTDFGDGFLWIATYGGGLSKMDKKNETFTHYTIENGLINNVCNGLLTDDHQNIWLNTNKGLVKFNPKTEKVINYTKADGLYFNEFNLNSLFKNKMDELMFGTPIGLVIFNPDDITTSTYDCPVLITSVDVNYKDATARMVNHTIDLYLNDKSITFHYAGLNFSNSPKIKYRYMLKGYNDTWIETNQRIANYTSLPDGDFTFLVNVTNEDGKWNTKPVAIRLIVHPPFYETWWFIIISCLLLLVIGILIIRYFAQRKIKKRLQELRIQQKIQQEKERISRDLHDNIGAQITYLISSIDQESYNVKQNQDIFEKLSDKARLMMTHLRQTIWVINKDAITLAEFVQKINDYSSNLLGIAGIEYNITLKGNENEAISPTLVSHIFRIVQEAQNNIIKHAKASMVVIDISIENRNLHIVISDNGIGIGNIQSYDDHFGLKNMKDRTMEINGQFKIMGNEQGTAISLVVPL